MVQKHSTHFALNEIMVVVFAGAALIRNLCVFTNVIFPATIEPACMPVVRVQRRDAA